MNGFDMLVLALVALSAFGGWVRGGAREIVDLIALFGSALIAALLMPVVGPVARRMIDPDFFGTIVAALATFAVFYIAIRLFGVYLNQKLKEIEVLVRVDRWVGVGIGLIRALLVLGVFHLAFHAITPPERIPGWYRTAAAYPVGVFSARAIQAILPAGAKIADAVAPRTQTGAAGGREQGS